MTDVDPDDFVTPVRIRVRLRASSPPSLYEWSRTTWALDVVLRDIRFSTNKAGKASRSYLDDEPPSVDILGAEIGSIALDLAVYAATGGVGVSLVSAVARRTSNDGAGAVIRLLTLIRDWGTDKRRAEIGLRQDSASATQAEIRTREAAARAEQEEIRSAGMRLDLDAKRRRMTYVSATEDEVCSLLLSAERDPIGSEEVIRLRSVHLGLTNEMFEAVRLLGATLDEVVVAEVFPDEGAFDS